MTLFKAIFLCILVSLSICMYDGNTPVITLKAKDFDRVNKGIWLVQFYAPWCGHCKNLAPQYQKAALGLKGIGNIAAIDASNQKVNVNIQGYPTIKLYVDGKQTDYNGQRTANGIIDFMLKQFRKIAMKRIGAGNSGSSGQHNQQTGSNDQKDVIILTQDNFQQLVYGDKNAWFVQFYAPWCGHCQRLTPEWAALATNLKGEVKVAKVDATQNQALASKFGVRGYPTIKFFKAGQKDDSSAIDYQGQRSQSSMAEWARQQTKGAGIFQHIQLNSQTVYDQNCKQRNLCVINFLPNLMDSSQQQRNRYLQIIKNVGLNFKGKPFKFLWVQGGDQFQVQQKLGVSGVGYPASIVLSENKQVYTRLRRSFSQQNLENFLNQVLKNKAKFSKLFPLPTLKTFQKSKLPQQGCNEHLCSGPAGEENKQEFAQQL